MPRLDPMQHSYDRLVSIHQLLDPKGDSLKSVEELVIELHSALKQIRDYDAFQGGPIAPRDNPTTAAMRRIAADAIRGQ
jgi:hypothetical protein